MSNDTCDSCPGVEAEHHLCDQCVEEDKEREEERVRTAVEAEREACAKAVCSDCRAGKELIGGDRHAFRNCASMMNPCDAAEIWKRS